MMGPTAASGNETAPLASLIEAIKDPEKFEAKRQELQTLLDVIREEQAKNMAAAQEARALADAAQADHEQAQTLAAQASDDKAQAAEARDQAQSWRSEAQRLQISASQQLRALREEGDAFETLKTKTERDLANRISAVITREEAATKREAELTEKEKALNAKAARLAAAIAS